MPRKYTKLGKKAKQKIINMLGAFEDLHTIQAELKRNWKKEITKNYLYQFRKDNAIEIDRLQAQYIQEQHHVLAANKVYRLKCLSELIADLKHKIWEPVKVDDDGNFIVYQGNHRDLGYLLSLARQEMQTVEQGAQKNLFFSPKVKQYFILTGLHVTEEQVQRLTDEDWRQLGMGWKPLAEQSRGRMQKQIAAPTDGKNAQTAMTVDNKREPVDKVL
jgi:hypothetical protein